MTGSGRILTNLETTTVDDERHDMLYARVCEKDATVLVFVRVVVKRPHSNRQDREPDWSVQGSEKAEKQGEWNQSQFKITRASRTEQARPP